MSVTISWTCPASCRSAPSRRSGSCRAAAGSPGSAGRGPASPSHRPSHPRRCRARLSIGSFSWQSASLPGRPEHRRARLCGTVSRALRAASRARAASTTFRRSPSRPPGSRRSQCESLLVHHLLDEALDLRGDQRSLVCEENFGSGSFTEMTAVRPSRASSPRASLFVLLLRARPALGVGVDRARERRLEALEVRAAVAVVDVVGERVDLLAVAVVPLQRDLERSSGPASFSDLLEVDRPSSCSALLFLFKCSTNEVMPPSILEVVLLARCARR
jgi:hypothetical protein